MTIGSASKAFNLAGMRCAVAHVEQARTALAHFPAGAERSVLEDIADYALVRKA